MLEIGDKVKIYVQGAIIDGVIVGMRHIRFVSKVTPVTSYDVEIPVYCGADETTIWHDMPQALFEDDIKHQDDRAHASKQY